MAIVDICGVIKVNGTFKKIVKQPFSFFPSTVLPLHCRIVEQRRAAPSTGAVDNCRLLINLTVFISKRLFTRINSRTHWAPDYYNDNIFMKNCKKRSSGGSTISSADDGRWMSTAFAARTAVT
jgi:hypothetical protein